jgi:hypothetical protein
VHAGYRDRTLTGLAIFNGHHASTVDAPGDFMLILAGRYAGITLDAAFGIAKEFRSS